MELSNGEPFVRHQGKNSNMRIDEASAAGRSTMKTISVPDKAAQFSKNPIKFAKELKNLATVTNEDKALHKT